MEENFNIQLEQIYENRVQKEYEREMYLWRAVIERAIEDFYLPETNKMYRIWKKQAQEWMNLENEEFMMVCLMADLNPKDVIKKCLCRKNAFCRW